MFKTLWKIFTVGAWAPFTIFSIHVLSGKVFHAYEIWPQIDIPMHFAGGLTFAFFVSRCFQELPRGTVQRGRSVVLELLLMGSFTVTAAVFWEFAEFASDQFFLSNIQVSLQNTMKDLVMGLIGAMAFVAIRAKQLRVGRSEFREIANDWVEGRAA